MDEAHFGLILFMNGFNLRDSWIGLRIFGRFSWWWGRLICFGMYFVESKEVFCRVVFLWSLRIERERMIYLWETRVKGCIAWEVQGCFLYSREGINKEAEAGLFSLRDSIGRSLCWASCTSWFGFFSLWRTMGLKKEERNMYRAKNIASI